MVKKARTLLIICPPSIKNNVIEIESSNIKLQNIKIMTTNEVKEQLFFKSSKKTIVYLCETYKFTTSFAKEIIKYLYYIDLNKKYDDYKIEFLQKIKKDLLNNKKLTENPLFKVYLKNVDVVFKYFDYTTQDDIWLINELSKITNVNNESISTLDYRQIDTLYEFDTLENEAIYLFDSFASLLNNGVSSDKIVLLNVTESSYFTLERLSKFYNISIDLPSSTSINVTTVGKEFISLLTNFSVKESLKTIKEKYATNELGIKLYNSILSIINEYSELQNYDCLKKYIIEDLATTKVPKENITNAIKIKQFSSYTYKEGDYVFIMNVNYGVFPKIYKDEDYLTDVQKEKLGMTASSKKNEEEMEKIKNKIFKIVNPILTYHLSTPFENNYPSFLNNKETKIIKNSAIKSPYSFSRIKDIYQLKKLEESKIYDNNYTYLYQHLNSLIIKYDPSYKTIPNNKIIEYYQAKKKLQLSYSAMNTYYQCKYRFFVERILKINKFESTFAINIGDIFHEVLSHIYDDDFNFNDCFEKTCSKFEFNTKEKFLLTKLKEELAFDIRVILDHYQEATLFKNQNFEKEIVVNYENKDIPLQFKGIIDKTMWYEDNTQKYIAIIDYKTGKTDIELDKLEYGIGLQLPVYLYLASKNDDFKDYKFAGFYLQKILPNEMPRTIRKTREQLRRDYLKLDGFSSDEQTIIAKFDNTYASSNYIKSMKLKNDGEFNKTAKILSQAKMKEYVDLVDTKIKEAFTQILNADFEINPLEIIENGKKNIIGCKYCDFKDICYKDYKKEDIKHGNELDS